jgi:hypothetical protein
MDHNVAAFNGEILVVGASNGFKWFWEGVERLASRFENFEIMTMDCSHHLHMDADTTQLVKLIEKFSGTPAG